MLKYLSTFLLIIMTAVTCFAGNIKVTVYSDEAYPPYSYKEDGRPVGIYTEIMQKIFSEMHGYDITIKPMPWKRGLKYIESGKGFAIYPPYKYPDKRPYFGIYSEPILNEQVVLICRNQIHTKKRIRWPEDFEDVTIGINRGFVMGGKKFLAAKAKNRIKIDEADSNKMNIIKLLRGRIDCYLNGNLSVIWTMNKMMESGELPEDTSSRIHYSDYSTTEHGYLGITGRDNGAYPFKADFIKQFNKILKRLKADGTIKEIETEFIIRKGIRPILHIPHHSKNFNIQN
ncbi:substrate-binding periplasmic protein [Maridesulfovibrio bastinii]|uniref:substrate-binding periplasmic protein n=1 Tax=Maridesulfovibrio bastinii TaxID=47157 RepID=UPI000A026739|nr:transporter substrate-binding domain-containing protein [Maridesulfovibrio bastinii]